MDGIDYMVELLKNEEDQITIIVLGPLSTIAKALQKNPEIQKSIKQLIWMGGALNVQGNVFYVGHDGSAEWNAFWDPESVSYIWNSSIQIVLTPLDITNQVPLTSSFIKQLARQRSYKLSELAGNCYALIAFQPYYFWDVLTSSYLGNSTMFTIKEWETSVIVKGQSQGRIKEEKGKRKILSLDQVDLNQFYMYILEQWKYL